jgi:hypothetical protein
MGKEKERLAFYNFDKIFSFNAFWNFLIGARGLGKTFGAKEKAISAAIKKGDQFIYVRRYKDELKKAKDSFFADVDYKFPQWDFRVQGYEAQMAPIESRELKNKREWQTIGFFIPLSTAQSQKSVSFPKVKIMIYDEFIIEKGHTHYLPNEATVFQNLYSTIDRYRGQVKVFFLANSVSIDNPYFLAYDIKPTSDQEFLQVAPIDGGRFFILCHFADSEEFKAGVYETAFGQFIKNTEYADYAVGSEFLDNHDHLLNLKTAHAKYHFTVETSKGTFSLWIDWATQLYYIQERRPKDEIVLTLVAEKMDEGKTLIQYNDQVIQDVRTAFRKGRAYFDTPKSRNAFIEIFKR